MKLWSFLQDHKRTSHIASKATLGDLARDWEKYSADLMNWQRELLKD